MGRCRDTDASVTTPVLSARPEPRARTPEADGGRPDTGRTVVILQPGYLPWLGFFDQMRRADVFVHYDDVQFDKHGWRNRNRVKGPWAEPHWLTVPVRHRGWPNLQDVEIDNRGPWARKHVATLAHFYASAPFLDRYLPELAELLERRWERLVDAGCRGHRSPGDLAGSPSSDRAGLGARGARRAERAPARHLPTLRRAGAI